MTIDLGGNYNIDVQGADVTAVQANLKGPESVINGITLERRGGEIVLTDSRQFGFFGASFREVTGTITVPRSTRLELEVSGVNKTDITNHTGEINVNASGSANLTFSNSTAVDPTVILSGASNLTLDQCRGEGRIEASGASKVVAQSCELSELTAEVSGASDITIQSGSITDFTGEASGASHIRLPRPSGTIKQNDSGASDITFN